MKWKSKIIIAAAIVLVAANLYLLLKDNSKVARSFYISEWTTAKVQNLRETMKTEGVTTPLEEQQVYFDERKGSFEGFLVKKGQEVQSGKTLFYYSTETYEDAIAVLESERDSLENQLDALEDKWDDLKDLDYKATRSVLDDELLINDYSVEIDLYQTEVEISRLESEIEKYDEQIDSIDRKMPHLEETSDIDGVVKNMNEDLSNPIITIVSKESMVKGMLSGDEQADIEPGMEVTVSLKNKDKTYKGTIQEVSIFPEDEPNVKMKSQYPFTVVLDKQVENLAHGTPVEVKITKDEVKNAITAPFSSMEKDGKTNWVYTLENGKVQRQKVTTGLHVNSVQQIKKGLKKGDTLAMAPQQVTKGTPTFYTPMQLDKWEKTMYKNLRKKELLKQTGKGFLSF
ncbi:efflux RND transporter periplasmic adaptor subunit [Bacillus tuaregi]|uniref:efflux RND transporter periplasmic adaptor subunit n=1 Tax=Bacillus tuaregi TaxID=1816695 RepID=UPI0008F8162B|nr:efflux RND transporter periplasmic adaptor subunit [Bacillus tuaregi]